MAFSISSSRTRLATWVYGSIFGLAHGSRAASSSSVSARAALRRGRVVTFEAPTSQKNVLAAAPLFEAKALQGLVFVDLPSSHTRPEPASCSSSTGQQLWSVRTIAAGRRTAKEVTKRLHSSLTEDSTLAAWLLVAGDARHRHPESGMTLDLPSLMKEADLARGGESNGPGLWCVANPLNVDASNEASRMMQKVEWGCEAFVTQPSLGLRCRVERWWQEWHRLMSPTSVLLGLALPSSVDSLLRWLKLCHVQEIDSDVQELVSRWRIAEASDPEDFQRFRDAEALAAFDQIQMLGVAGVHLMPLTATGYADALRLHAGAT